MYTFIWPSSLVLAGPPSAVCHRPNPAEIVYGPPPPRATHNILLSSARPLVQRSNPSRLSPVRERAIQLAETNSPRKSISNSPATLPRYERRGEVSKVKNVQVRHWQCLPTGVQSAQKPQVRHFFPDLRLFFFGPRKLFMGYTIRLKYFLLRW